MATASNCSSNTWDAENRLVRSEPAGIATNGAVRLINRYDHRHRRIQKYVEVLTGRGAGYPVDPSQPGTWDVVETRSFLYDGWLPVIEKILREGAGTEVREHVWGRDLGGGRGSTGGVGGLLATRINCCWYFPLYDVNGNITDYLNTNGTVVAHRGGRFFLFLWHRARMVKKLIRGKERGVRQCLRA